MMNAGKYNKGITIYAKVEKEDKEGFKTKSKASVLRTQDSQSDSLRHRLQEICLLLMAVKIIQSNISTMLTKRELSLKFKRKK